MRKCFTISLILAAATLVGCQTQSWRDTDFAPGAGRGADTPWQIQGGLIELTAGGTYGFAGIDDAKIYDPKQDVDSYRGRGFVGAAYMLNDYWEVGAFFEYGWETWESDDFDDVDVDGWSIAPELTYNFSTVSPDIVPFWSLSGGIGQLNAELDDSDADDDIDRWFGQLTFGIRFFAWDGIAWNFEGYWRYTNDDFDDADVTVRSDYELGAILSLSVFF